VNKTYQEIKFYAGQSVESAVIELLGYKRGGILAKGDFNGVTLYSDTVTMDDAYKQITGKTKDEYEKMQQDWRDEYDRQQREYEEKIPELTEIWRQKGREVLTEDKWEYWDEIVPIRLRDLYHGMELGNCLEIVKVLNGNGTFEEAKEILKNQGHSGMSYSLVCAMVRDFCDRGQEFVEYVK
jgi:predicted nuclease with TOPRIM domain